MSLEFHYIIEKNQINFDSFFCLLWHTLNIMPKKHEKQILSSALFLQILEHRINLGTGLPRPGKCLLPPVKPRVRIAPDKSECRAPTAWPDILVT